MKVGRLEEVYRSRILMFLFKNQHFFQLHYNKLTNTRLTVAKVAALPTWRKVHSRMQSRYQGAKYYLTNCRQRLGTRKDCQGEACNVCL